MAHLLELTLELTSSRDTIVRDRATRCAPSIPTNRTESLTRPCSGSRKQAANGRAKAPERETFMSEPTTTTTKKITVVMSERPPLRISEAAWPLIASAKQHDGQVECQANRIWRLRVRQHADGRTLVYGTYSSGYLHESDRAGGFLLSAEQATGEEIVRTIRRVAGIVTDDDQGDQYESLAQACIAELPAEEI